ncbi:MAG: hypothetical protein ACXWNG_06260 [Candidatus Limnocylindrales bacterium]
MRPARTSLAAVVIAVLVGACTTAGAPALGTAPAAGITTSVACELHDSRPPGALAAGGAAAALPELHDSRPPSALAAQDAAAIPELHDSRPPAALAAEEAAAATPAC